MSRSNLAWLAGLSAVALIGLSMFMSVPSRAGTLQKKHENYKLVVDALEEIQQKYAKEMKPEEVRKLIEDMINGGLRHLDQHSYFYNKKDYKEFKTQSSGRFGGIGIQIGMNKFDQLYVISPIVGTPAYEGGMLAGDLIVKIDDKTTEKMDIEEAKTLIIGEPGTKVRITVIHEGDKKTKEIELTRAEIQVDSVLGDRRSKVNLKEWDFWIDEDLRIAHVRVTSFTETTTAEMVKVVDALERLGMKALVIDLRNNPGGLLKAAVELSSLFLPDGKHVVTTRGRSKDEETVYNSRPPVPGFKPHTSYPIVILVNRGSASASEILAAALQDHVRGVVIGERSYGKGSVQNMIPMEGGTTALKITTAIYWRPSGRNIHRFKPGWDEKDTDDWGVKPNEGFDVKLTDEEFRDWMIWRRDRDIIKRDDTKKDDPADITKKDKVLARGLEYLREELKKRAARDGDAAPVAAMPAVIPDAPAPMPIHRADAHHRTNRDGALLNRTTIVR